MLRKCPHLKDSGTAWQGGFM